MADPVDPHPDAKLIELGQQFEKAKAEALPLEKEKSRLRLACDVTAQSMGIPDYAEAASAHKKLWRESGYRAASDAFLAKHSEAVRLMKAIHRTKATTLEGFAVKIAAVVFDQTDYEVCDPAPTDVAERQLYRVARDMAKVVKKRGGSSCA